MGEGRGSEEIQHLVDAVGALRWREMADAEGYVVGGGEVREERGLLGEEADGAASGRDGGAGVRVEEGFSIEMDAAAGGRGRPARMRRMVLLPAPEGPKRTVHWAARENSAWRRKPLWW